MLLMPTPDHRLQVCLRAAAGGCYKLCAAAGGCYKLCAAAGGCYKLCTAKLALACSQQ
jgi:hypothetical protein